MTKKRVYVSELARLLGDARQPIYVLDDEWTLIFLNRAAGELLGPIADEVLGQKCAYGAPAGAAGAAPAAAALCPPPAAMGGQQGTGVVAFLGPDGMLRRRRARFLPLGSEADDPIGVVVVAGTADLPETPADVPAETPQGEPTADELHDLIRRFRRQAAGRLRADRLVGTSPAVRRARRQVELAAASRCSVLIVGPPGSGRQHTAADIHYAGDPDAAGMLVPLACSVLGAELIHSTVTALAASQPPGAASPRSTLLLNDADQLPEDVQAELAAVLLSRPFPLRPIATAVQPLAELARRGRFREDLAAGLSTIQIELPALAERREDLPLLAQMFLEEINAPGGKQVGGFSPEALDRLDAYAFSGNLDELVQVVAEAHRRAAGPEIAVADLPERLHLAVSAAAHPRRTEETIVLDEFLGRVERELIRRALARAKGNKAKAARLLGLTRPRLYRRMIQLGLVKE